MDSGRFEAVGRRLVALDRNESLRLMATVPVGRLIFTMNALPAVRVMNFVLAGNEIVVRTAAGNTVTRKAAGAVVAFEADALDIATSTGWSVTVTGRAKLVGSVDAGSQYAQLGLVPWAPGVRDQYVTIGTDLVEGQQIVLTGVTARADA